MFKFIGSCFRWVGLQLGIVQGSVDKKNDQLSRNPTLIRQEGKAAKDELVDQWEKLNEVVTNKVKSRTEKEMKIKRDGERLVLVAAARTGKITRDGGKDAIEKLGFQLANVKKVKDVATSRYQKRSTELGVTRENKAPGLADAEWVKHRDAIGRMTEQEERITSELDRIEQGLKKAIEDNTKAVRVTNSQLTSDKGRLESLETQIGEIDGNVEDVVSNILSAEDAKRNRAMRSSIDTTAAESRLNNLKRLNETAIAETMVANELSTGGVADQDYLDDYGTSAIDDELDALLSTSKTAETDHVAAEREVENLPNG